ncbi:hypothetical protein NX059_009895 [Plenodomus lindquistii]|nr:hypothetical protein NX059_009895 [Plenodomus lindquistii]
MGRPNQEPRQSEDRTSITSSRGAVENGTYTSLATAFNFADFVVTSNKASTETISFANLIHAVRQDLTETSRLYLSPAVTNFLDAWPDKRAWIESTLSDVRRALNDIGMDVDAGQHDNSESEAIVSRRKFDWAVTHQRRLSKKQQQLHACHHNLAGAMHVMQTVELCGLPGSILQEPIFEAPVRPWVPTDGKNASRGPYSRQRYRGSQTNLSISSVNLSEPDKDVVDTSSVHSTPVELPGCIPVQTTQFEDCNPRISSSLPSPRLTTLQRSRALSSHMRPSTTRNSEPNLPSDVVSELSTRKASPIQRNDSTASTLASINTSMVARRYRAYAVEIHPQREKHQSLPSELPQLRHQSSLMNDLEGYVLASAASERLPSREWTSSAALTPRRMSVTGCPDIPEVEPNATEAVNAETADADVVDAKELPKPTNDNGDTLSSHRDTLDCSTDIAICAKSDVEEVALLDHSSRLKSSQSLTRRKPVPAATRVDRSRSLPTIPMVDVPSSSNLQSQDHSLSNDDDDMPLFILRERLRNQKCTEVFGANLEEGTSAFTPQSDDLVVVGALVEEQDTAKGDEANVARTATPMMSAEKLTTPEEEIPSLEVASAPTPQTSTASMKLAESIRSTSSSKSMSAQARRRAAHARRMEIAFGKA